MTGSKRETISFRSVLTCIGPSCVQQIPEGIAAGEAKRRAHNLFFH